MQTSVCKKGNYLFVAYFVNRLMYAVNEPDGVVFIYHWEKSEYKIGQSRPMVCNLGVGYRSIFQKNAVDNTPPQAGLHTIGRGYEQLRVLARTFARTRQAENSARIFRISL